MAPKAEEPITLLNEELQDISSPEVLTTSMKETVSDVVVETVETEEEDAAPITPEEAETNEAEPINLVADMDEEQLEQTAATAAMCTNLNSSLTSSLNSTLDFASMMTCCGLSSVFASAEVKREQLENEKATQIQCAARSMMARKTAKTLQEEKAAAAEAAAKAAAEAEAKAAAEAEAKAAAEAAEVAAAAAEAAKEQAPQKKSSGKKSFFQKLFSGCTNSQAQVASQ